MTTTTTPAPTVPPELELADLPQHIVLEGATWDLYESLLQEVGDQNLRITFDEGRLEIMSPLPKHEKWKKMLARLLEAMSEEMKVVIASRGSTTFRRGRLQKGAEPDECYYIQHAAQMAQRDTVDLEKDPPPDLVIDVDITHATVPKQPIYAKLGVPEVWHFDGSRLTFLHRQSSGRYAPAERSLAFGFLNVADIQPFVEQARINDENAVLGDWRKWIRENYLKQG